jgi:hypothetical protein
MMVDVVALASNLYNKFVEIEGGMKIASRQIQSKIFFKK